MNAKSLFKKTVNILTLASFLVWNLAVAVPEGGSVAQGSADISQSGSQTTVTQTSQNAVINWHGFDTAATESVKFTQPNSSSIALNRINSGIPTNFQGSLSANGQVWIVNPSGVLFGAGSKVDVAGLLVTTHNITDSNFMNGNYQFTFDPNSANAKIINNGLITAKDSGIVGLVAPWVENNGVIIAHLGKVHLASGSSFVLDMYGDQLINFGSNPGIQNGYVSNSGLIQADGGKVHMTANAAAGILNDVISMSGTIEAKSVGVNQKGEIVLYASDAQTKKLSGTTRVSGKLDASDGGFIETSGNVVVIEPTTVIDVGDGGSWYMDPTDVTIDSTLAAIIVGVLDGNGVYALNATGNIFVNSPIIQNVGTGNGHVPVSGQPFVVFSLTAGESIQVNAAISLIDNIFTFAFFLPSSVTELSLTAGQDININAPITISLNTNWQTHAIFTAGAGFNIYLNTSIAPTLTTVQNLYVDFESPVILQSDVTFTGAGVQFLFNGTVDGDGILPRNLTFDNTITFSPQFFGDIGGNNPLGTFTSTQAPGTPEPLLNGVQLIKTIGAQTYGNGLTTLTPTAIPLTLQSTSGAIITLNAVLTGQGTPSPSTLTIMGDFVLGTASGIRNASGFPDVNTLTVTGTTTLQGSVNWIITNNDQTYQGPVTIGSVTPFFAQFELKQSGTIKFESTVDGSGAGVQPVNFIFHGTTPATDVLEFDGKVGGLQSLSNITVSNVNVTNAVTINMNALNIANFVVNTTGFQTYGGHVVLGGDATLSSTAGNITFDSTVDGGFDLVLAANAVVGNIATGPGLVVFNGLVGNSAPLNSLSVTSRFTRANTTLIKTVNNQTYITTVGGPGGVGVVQNTINFWSTSGGNISFNGPLTSQSSPSVANANVTITGNLVFDLPNGNAWTTISNFDDYDWLTSLHVTRSSDFKTPTGVITYQDQTYDGPVTVENDFIFVVNNGGKIWFKDTLQGSGGSWDVEVNQFFTPGIVQFDGAVSSINNLLVAGTEIDINAGTITTSNTQTYTGPVVLLSDNILTSINSGINFSSTVDSDGTPRSLTLNAFSPTILSGNIGTGFGGILSTLHIINEADINTGIIHTVDAQLYDGIVILGNNTKLTVDNGITGQIIFGNTVSGPFDLVIDPPAIVQFNADVNTASLNVQATQEIQINTANMLTSGDQLYDAPAVVLQFSPGSTLTSTGGNITFNGTVDGGFDLTADASLGVVGFNGDVGSSSLLNILTVTGATNINTAQILTSGEQIYNSPVTLMTNVLFSSTGANVGFGDTVDGPFALTANAMGVGFSENVGGISPLISLDITAGFVVALENILSIETTGTQTYNAPFVIVNSPLNLTIIATDPGSIVIFNQGLLTINLGTAVTIVGDTIFRGPFYPISFPLQELGPIVVTGTTLLDGVTVQSSSQTYQGAVTITASNATLNSPSVEFDSTVEGPGGLIVNGDMLALDNMGFTVPLGYLTVNGTATGINIISVGDINLGPFNVITNDFVQSLTGNVSFLGGPVTLFADLTVSAANKIFFGFGANGVTGPYSLTAMSFNPANAATGAGITGTVNVTQFSMGGTGGGNISPLSQDSTVNSAGARQAFVNTIILSGALGFYCVNGFCSLGAVLINDIPPKEIFNIPSGVSCDASGCTNLELIMDNFIEAGIVSCAGNGCPYGFVEARDSNGNSRILMQGDVVYAGDTLLKEKGTCVCVKAVSGKKVCYGPNVTKVVHNQ